MQALGLTNTRVLDLTHIEPVLLLMRAETNPRPLNLYTFFALRSLAIGWRFDGRQHDAAEFFDSITATAFGDLQPTPWQARVDPSEVGQTPIFLPVGEDIALLSLLDNWFDRGAQHGLLTAPGFFQWL